MALKFVATTSDCIYRMSSFLQTFENSSKITEDFTAKNLQSFFAFFLQLRDQFWSKNFWSAKFETTSKSR